MLVTGTTVDAGEMLVTGTTVDAGEMLVTGTTVDAGEMLVTGTTVDAGEMLVTGTTVVAGEMLGDRDHRGRRGDSRRRDSRAACRHGARSGSRGEGKGGAVVDQLGTPIPDRDCDDQSGRDNREEHQRAQPVMRRMGG